MQTPFKPEETFKALQEKEPRLQAKCPVGR